MSSIIINNEECRVVPGFKKYHISESGRIYRTRPFNKREEKRLASGEKYLVEKMLFYSDGRQANCSLGDDNGKLHYIVVAYLMAEAFGLVEGKFNRNKNSIEYIDGNKKNLHYTNLRVAGKRHNNGKLNPKQVKEIKKKIKDGIPLKHIGLEYGVSEMQINRIKTGENWGNGKRKIKAPKAPFPIKDGKVRRYVAMFDSKPAPKNIKKPFTIKRNPKEPTDNTIIGIVNGYKLSLKHKNITRARINVDKLNAYFFNNKKPEDNAIKLFF